MDKVCTRCRVPKPRSAYHTGKSTCRDCVNERTRLVYGSRRDGTWRGRTYTRVPVIERVRARTVEGPTVIPELGPCWLWTGSVNAHGYGQVSDSDKGRPEGTHRVAFEDANGPIGAGLELDHLCEVKTCVRPSHLEAITKAEHSRRSCARLDEKRPGWRLGA